MQLNKVMDKPSGLEGTPVKENCYMYTIFKCTLHHENKLFKTIELPQLMTELSNDDHNKASENQIKQATVRCPVTAL